MVQWPEWRSFNGVKTTAESVNDAQITEGSNIGASTPEVYKR